MCTFRSPEPKKYTQKCLIGILGVYFSFLGVSRFTREYLKRRIPKYSQGYLGITCRSENSREAGTDCSHLSAVGFLPQSLQKFKGIAEDCPKISCARGNRMFPQLDLGLVSYTAQSKLSCRRSHPQKLLGYREPSAHCSTADPEASFSYSVI